MAQSPKPFNFRSELWSRMDDGDKNRTHEWVVRFCSFFGPSQRHLRIWLCEFSKPTSEVIAYAASLCRSSGGAALIFCQHQNISECWTGAPDARSPSTQIRVRVELAIAHRKARNLPRAFPDFERERLSSHDDAGPCGHYVNI